MSVGDSGELDVRLLVRWLGAEGAKAGLEASKGCTVEVLRALAQSFGIPLPSKGATRNQLIEEIIRVADRRIEKSLKELMQLSEEQLSTYFEQVEPSRGELLDLLAQIDATPTKESRKSLVLFAARELSETGRFMRIASSDGETKATTREPRSDGRKG